MGCFVLSYVHICDFADIFYFCVKIVDMTTILRYNAIEVSMDRFDKFTGLILNISRCIQKIKNSEMASLGLKGKQVQCLFHLYSCKEGASVTKLSMLCGEDKGAISRTIKELENEGYVFLDEQGNKKYKNHIKLTEKGNEVGMVIFEKIGYMLGLGSAGIKEQDRSKLYDMLSQISNNLQKICENYGEKND